MSCAPDCESWKVWQWPAGGHFVSRDVKCLQALTLCPDHDAEREAGLSEAKRLGRTVSRLEARIARDVAALVPERPANDNTETKGKRK